MSTEPISRFFDREAEACCRHGDDEPVGVSGVSSVLLEYVERTGIEGRTLLDLGCGTGGFVIEALRRGAASGLGVDVSSVSIEAASRLARFAGLGERAGFRIGDASAVHLERHDVVVLNKSICCYPKAEALVENAVRAASHVCAFSVPVSRGVRGLVARTTVRLENAWRAIRRDPFRAYVHPTDAIEAKLRAARLERVASVRWWTWYVGVFVREPVEVAASPMAAAARRRQPASA
ncbi:MAG TPA: class I SAM-dependent methyltransferase [Actinomycetota bacterium]|nr:class I SAM-dependent methyltransferase [Actinomycetota bacterium]